MDAQAVEPGEDQSFWRTVTAGSISDAVISADMNGNISGWNRAAETIYGWRQSEVLGTPAAAVLKTHFIHDAPEELQAQLMELGRWRGEVLQERRDGSVITILTSVYVARDTSGNPIGTVSVNIDITERRRAEDEIRRRTAHAEALVRVAARLNEQLDLDAVLNAVCKEASTALNIPAAVAFLYDEEKEVLRPAAHAGLPVEIFERFRPIPRESADSFTRRFGPLVVIPNVQTLANMVNGDLYLEQNFRTVVDARIEMRDGTLVGALRLYVPMQPRKFTDDELNLVRGLADLAAQAIHNARLFTAYKRSEDALRKATDRLHHLLTSSPVGIYSLSASGGLGTTFVAGSRDALLGFEDREYLEDPGLLIHRLHPDDSIGFLNDVAHLSEKESYSSEYRFLHHDGSYRWMHSQLRLMRDASGAPLEIIGTWLDITRRKEAEEELRRQTARAEALVRFTERLNNQFDLGALLTTVCEETAQALRVPAVTLTLYDDRLDAFTLSGSYGMPDAFLQQQRPTPRAVYEDLTRRRGRLVIIPDIQAVPGLPNADIYAEFDIHTMGGVAMMLGDELVGGLNIMTRGEPRSFTPSELMLWQGLADQAAQAIVNARLLAERKRAEARLVMADRLSSLGALAAGMAHEINNPLAYVVGNLELIGGALTRLRESPGEAEAIARELDQPLQEALDGVSRIRTLVRDLKTFSRVDEEQLSPIDPREVLQVAMRMVTNDVRHRARLVLNLGDVPAVQANASRLGQVFVNLLVNAVQAFPSEDPDRNAIRVSTFTAPEGRAVIEVVDNGQGIPEKVLGLIFDPFFTTKPMGTGLGLSICHSIVKRLGGELTAESKVGRGSVFRVILPGTRDEIPAAAPPGPAPAQIRRSRIMVIDDEPMIGRSLHRKLSPDHDVVTLDDAREALRRLENGESFDVILCDLMMPEMTGMDLYAEVRNRFPEVAERMVFLTGGTFTGRARAFLDAVPNARLEKPFTEEELRGVLRERLGNQTER